MLHLIVRLKSSEDAKKVSARIESFYSERKIQTILNIAEKFTCAMAGRKKLLLLTKRRWNFS